MFRRFRHLLLVLVIACQAGAAAGMPLWLSAAAGDLAHEAMHWSQFGHHHHDDGSYHAEDSSESDRHMQAEGALQPAGLISGDWQPQLPQAHQSPLVVGATDAPPAFIPPPQRPPR